MVGKRLVTVLTAIIGTTFLCTGCIGKKEVVNEEAIVATKSKVLVEKPLPTKVVEKKYDLYNTTPYDIPLYSINEISKLPKTVKDSVDKILDLSQGFYLLHCSNDKVLIILQNPILTSDIYPRHELQFAEIDMAGNVKYHTAGYAGIDGETINAIVNDDDVWYFDESSEPRKPIKHIAYNEKGKVKFTEIWNYKEDEAVKYQMLDAHKKVISILKESQDNDSNLRREHVFYDNEGNTFLSLSVNYDGANISRMTFYNSHDSIDSMSILSEYEDGHKIKESVYNENYELINIITSDYVDGERRAITVFDKEGVEVNKISS